MDDDDANVATQPFGDAESATQPFGDGAAMEEDVKDAIATIELTSHGEIHLDKNNKPAEWNLTWDIGLNQLVYISAVWMGSDAINYGVCQVQERAAWEIEKMYNNNEWYPSLNDIIKPLKRVRDLDEKGKIPRTETNMNASVEIPPATMMHQVAQYTAKEDAADGDYDAQRYYKMFKGGQTWRTIVLTPKEGDEEGVKFLNKTYLVTSDEMSKKPTMDNNAWLFLPGGPPVMQMIANFSPQQQGFSTGLMQPEPGSLLQESPKGFPQIEVDKSAIGKGPCANMIDGEAAAGHRASYPALEAIVETDPDIITTVSTRMECIVKNAVEAYRKKTGNPDARLDALVIVDLTCQVLKDSDETFTEQGDQREKRIQRFNFIRHTEQEYLNQFGAQIYPTLTKYGKKIQAPGPGKKRPLEPETAQTPKNRQARKMYGGTRRLKTRRRHNTRKQRKTRIRQNVSKTRKPRIVKPRIVKPRMQRKTHGKRKTRGQRKTRR